MRIGLMVEGQNGVTWERWIRILGMAERLGFPSVFRSDHFFIGTQQDSIEAYLSFAVAARETRSIRFGPLVSPVTFRTPVDLGRMAGQLSLLSGGRFVMGMGAGWNEPEHRAYGIPFPEVKERMDRLEEAIQVVKAMWAPGPADFEGKYYRLDGADPLPKPEAGKPPLIIGGGGEQRTLKLVAKYADEWNAVNMTPEVFRHKLGVLEKHCEAVGRDPTTIRKSMMCFGMVGPSEEYVDQLLERFGGRLGKDPGVSRDEKLATARSRGMIAGGTEAVVEQLKALEELGMEEVQFQHFDFDSEEVPAYLAEAIAPLVG